MASVRLSTDDRSIKNRLGLGKIRTVIRGLLVEGVGLGAVKELKLRPSRSLGAVDKWAT